MGIKKTYHEIKEWNHRINQRMQDPVAIPDVDHTYHICTHCEYGYHGNFCPQCGLPAEHHRFTFKRLISNFLDIWGFGNRPMFRTIRDLFWRPGYMIRDYLGGHHLNYFPPFKMLAVFTIVIVFLTWVFDFHDPIVGKDVAELLKALPHSGTFATNAIDFIGRVIIYLDKYDLYRILLQNVFVVLAAWIVFHKKGYNLVETFFSQIYINCQFHLITMIWMLIVWDLPPTVFLPYYVPFTISFFVLIFDYKQLYGLTLMQSIWRTILFVLLVFVIYIILFLFLVLSIEGVDTVVQ